MNANFDLKSIKIKPLLTKYSKRFDKHAIFAVLLTILVCYLFVIFRISSLAKAEPDSNQQVEVTNSIPKIDKQAVDRIQSLEQSNTQIHSLFENARNNPFQE